MDYDLARRVFVLFFLSVGCSFFAFCELTFLSADSLIKYHLEKNQLLKRYLISLNDNYKKTIITLLIGKTILKVGLAILAIEFSIHYFSSFYFDFRISILILILIVSLVILFFSELVPKVVTNNYFNIVSKICILPFFWINTFIYPITELVNELLKFFLKFKIFNVPDKISNLKEFDNGVARIDNSEQNLIQGIVEYKKVIVREIMKPRVDIIAVIDNSTFEQVIQKILDSGHSRIPIYKENLDQIIGIIYSKDLLQFIKNKEIQKQFSVTKVARKTLFIPETKLISQLMNEFQEKKLHIAIVVDEYGGTSGLITLEDILEEIVGEIRNEYDKEEEQIIKLRENVFLVNGVVPIDEVNILLGINFQIDEDEYDTIGGFVLNYAGEIPNEGFSFDYEGFKFTVKQITRKRIQKIMIEKN